MLEFIPAAIKSYFKGKEGMPWQEIPMKDVASCEKPRGAAKRALIRGYPNGATCTDDTSVYFRLNI